MKHEFAKTILKECDIRGVIGTDLFVEDAYFVGRAFGAVLRNKGISHCWLGLDVRPSSADMAHQTASGLREEGIDVTYLGVLPTPAVYFAVRSLNADGNTQGAGIMVTASHNPPEYNGFKFIIGNTPFHKKDILELAGIAASGELEKKQRPAGRLEKKNIIDTYVSHLLQFLTPAGKGDKAPEGKNVASLSLKIVWDPGNGAASPVLPVFLAGLPGRHSIICGEEDGSFPNHHPDPAKPENMQQLCREVISRGADLGIAFDGDGDRIGVVDGKGNLLKGDELLVLFARDYLQENPGAVVMTEVKAGRLFIDEVTALGGVPLLWKVGHTNQKEKMLSGIGLAGETSGHFFFKESGGFDDAFLAAVKLLNIIQAEPKSIDEIFRDFPRYSDSGEIRLSLPDEERSAVLEAMKADLQCRGRKADYLDGIRAEIPGGFWIIRSSNTQPDLTIRCEAEDDEKLSNGLADLKSCLSAAGVSREKLAILNNA